MRTVIQSLQWFLFIISGSIVVPITVASLYGLEAQDTVDFIARTFFVLAVTGLLQVLFGHRLPINEGPAGLWWGIFLLYASLGSVLYGSQAETLRVLEFALIISGIICFLLSFFGVIDGLAKYFTNAVTGTYLLLLVAQLSGSFIKGMLGVELTGRISIPTALLSILIIVLSLMMSRHAALKQFNIIGAIAVGWPLFYLLIDHSEKMETAEIFSLPRIFAFGIPRLDWSIVPTVFIVTLLLITNMLASIKVVDAVLSKEGKSSPQPSMKKSGIMMGVSQMLGGVFGAMGSVPISGAAGFIATSKITHRLPFITSLCLIIAVSFFSPAISVLAALPPAVGYAAVFPVFAGMVTLGLRELFQSEQAERNIHKVSLPLFVGIGAMFVPAASFSSLPPIISSLLSNGLVLGTILCLVFEIVEQRNNKIPDDQKSVGNR